MSPPDLLDLSNCVILQLLSYLDATSLYLLSKTCTRLDNLIKSHTSLWKSVDARGAPNDRTKLLYCMDMMNESTHRFLVRGNNQFETLVPPEFYTKISHDSFENLRVIAIENQVITFQYTIMSFPKQLHELSLRRTAVLNRHEFFQECGGHMKELRVLILDECDWVTTSALVPISKYPSLEIVSVYKCKNMEDTIPYRRLSLHYAFKKLKIFDARLTPLGDTLIRWLYRSQSLLAIYLQNDDLSYKLDYFKRKLQIIRGAPSRDYSVEDDEFDLDDLNDSLMNEDNSVNNKDTPALDDQGLLHFLSTVSVKNSTELPQSSLYLDPYNDCTCGYEERQRKKQKSNHKKKPPSDSSVRQIENKIAHLTGLVNWSQRTNVSSRRPVNHPRRPFIVVCGYCTQTQKDQIDNIVRDADVRDGMNQDDREDMIMELEKYRRNNDEEKIRKIIEYMKRRQCRCRPSNKPENKRPKIEEPKAGPSGLNNFLQDYSDDPQPYMVRVPRVNNPRINNRRVNFFRNQIPEDIRKENKVPLRRLSLRGYKKITNTALHYVKDLDLELLDLTYTDVSMDGINNYLVDHPSCRIVHEGFCVCPTNLHF